VWRSAGKGACFASRGNNQEAYWGGLNGYGNTGEGPTEQLILYSPGGQKMGAYCVGFSPNMQYFAVTASEENVYYGGRLVGKRIAALSVANSGVVSAFTADRLQSKGNGSNYYPYGESKSSTAGDDREGFATYTRDEKSGLDYADQRWYASGVGRFTSPDPYMAERGGGHSLLRPSSFGRYAYVEGNPASYFDPLGLMIAKPQEGPPPNQPSNGDRSVLGDGMAETVDDNEEWGQGGGSLDPERLVLDGALATATEIVFREKCAKLFLGEAGGNLEARKELSKRIGSQFNNFRTTDVSGFSVEAQQSLQNKPNVLAVTLQEAGLVYMIRGRGFFTGVLSNGKLLSESSDFAGLSIDSIRAVIVLHELLHLFGAAGEDDKNQRIVLPNGNIVYGSSGVTKAVTENCFK
jgi:RHS repeat-associated protein